MDSVLEGDERIVRDRCVERFKSLWSADEIEYVIKKTNPDIHKLLPPRRGGGAHDSLAEILLDVVGLRFLRDIDSDTVVRQRFLTLLLKAAAQEDDAFKEKIIQKAKGHLRWGRRGNITGLRTVAEIKATAAWCKVLAQDLGLPPYVAERDAKDRRPTVEVVEPRSPLNPLYDYQYSAAMYVREMLEGRQTEGGRHVLRRLIAVPTGAGKTRMVVEAIIRWLNDGRPSANEQQRHSKFIVWIAQSSELCEQAVDTFRDVFESIGRRGTRLRLHRCWGEGATLPPLGASYLVKECVIVCTINSLYKIQGNDPGQMGRLGGMTACIVVDEAHRSTTKMYSTALGRMGFNWNSKQEISEGGIILVGLTATPFRGDKDTQRLLRRYGGVLHPPIPLKSGRDNFEPHAILDCQSMATTGEPVCILGEKSYDRDGRIVKWGWSVARHSSGGAPASGSAWTATSYDAENLAITFHDTGDYTVRLTVTDNEGATSSASADITVLRGEGTDSTSKQKDLYHRLIQRHILCQTYHHVLPSPMRMSLSQRDVEYMEQFGEFPNATIKDIGRHAKRNEAILQGIDRLWRAGRRKVLFFGCSVEHSRLVSALLKMTYGINSAYVDSRMDPDSRMRAIAGFRDGDTGVLCNYGVLTTGFDAPGVDCVFVGRPVRSTLLYTQMIGRGMRGVKSGGTPDMVLVDMDDNFQMQDQSTVELGWKIFEPYWKRWEATDGDPSQTAGPGKEGSE